jgi:hypothetical protein
MTPSDLGQQSLALLARVLADASREGKETVPIKHAFIYRHAHQIALLANDVFMLEALESCTSARILIRPMVGSLFKLVAAAKDESFAIQKIVAELEGQVERIDEWIKVQEDPDFTDAMTPTAIELYACAQDLRSEHGISSRNKWSLHDTAKKSGLPSKFASDHFYFSQHLHGTLSEIIGAEGKAFRGHTVQSATSITLVAAHHAAEGLCSEGCAPRHLEEAAKLLDVLEELVKAGHYAF